MSEPIAIPVPPEAVEAIAAEAAERAAELVLARVGRSDGSPWLSLSEAAEYLRISERTLQRLLKKKCIRVATVGRRLLLHRDDLDAYVRAAGEE